MAVTGRGDARPLRVPAAEDDQMQARQLGHAGASMRPRVFPAEDDGGVVSPNCIDYSFNEAAGIPRGRRWQERWGLLWSPGFNEAAGIPRGRLWVKGQIDRRWPELQ